MLEDDSNNELLFLMATAHYNLQSYSRGIEFAELLEKVSVLWACEAQRLKKALMESPNVPELQAQFQEVEKLLADLRTGLKEHPEADELEEEEKAGMDEE